jgi:hypothetical protein
VAAEIQSEEFTKKNYNSQFSFNSVFSASRDVAVMLSILCCADQDAAIKKKEKRT